MITMNPKIKEDWIKALTSGEYEQTKGVLKNNNGRFCCLGVLCDLFLKSHEGIGYWDKDNIFMLHDSVSDEFDQGENAELPEAVMEWAGLETSHGLYGEKNLLSNHRTLVRDNDSGEDFTVIAKTIEREF